MLRESINATLIVRVIRQKLGSLSLLGIRESSKEPHESPWIVPGSRTDIGAGQVGAMVLRTVSSLVTRKT